MSERWRKGPNGLDYYAKWRREQQRRWRQHGCCVSCGEPTGLNPHTGKPFARCFDHRIAASRYSQNYHRKHGRPDKRKPVAA